MKTVSAITGTCCLFYLWSEVEVVPFSGLMYYTGMYCAILHNSYMSFYSVSHYVYDNIYIYIYIYIYIVCIQGGAVAQK